jgi:ABC-2 type transport system ATP-binding protein
MLSVQNLGFKYSGAAQPSLVDISFAVKPGDIVGLLGPNGAGKTTLISQLANILPIQQGSITVDGLSLVDSRRKNPARIAIAPQDYAFYHTLTVKENLNCFGAIYSSVDLPQRVERALVFTQLERYSNQQACILSGGLKRRLNLAIAMLAKPDYILLDEPTVGVDPQSRAFLLDSVQQLAKEGLGVVYTSHYMEEVEAIAKRIVIIDHGKILIQGGLSELLAQGRKQLNFLQSGLSDVQVNSTLTPFGELQTPQQLLLYAESNPITVLVALAEAGAQIQQVEFGRFNLEQLFMQLTHRSLRD